MTLTGLSAVLAEELARRPVESVCCRRAEAAALLQTAPTPGAAGLRAAAERRLYTLYGHVPWSQLHLILGLRSPAGRTLTGLPAALLIRAKPCCLTALCRGAVLAAGTLRPRTDRLGLRIDFLQPETAVAVAGALTRLHFTARLSPAGDGEQLHVAEATDLLHRFDATGTLTIWQQRHHTDQHPPRSAARSAHNANTLRAQTAAAVAVTRLKDLVDSGRPIPADLAPVARLRLQHPTASLTELAALSDPPLTKDTIAGRLRRLLLMPDPASVR